MPSIPAALGSESPIVAEVSFSSGAGPIALSGALGSYFRFSDVLDDGMCIAVTVSDESGQKEAFFAKFQGGQLAPITMIISSNGNQKISWPTSGQRIVRLMIGAVPTISPTFLPGSPPLCTDTDGKVVIAGGCLCSSPSQAAPPSALVSGTGNVVFDGNANGGFDNTNTASFGDVSQVGRNFFFNNKLTTQHSNDLLIAMVSVYGAPHSATAPTVTSITDTSGLTWQLRARFNQHLTVPPNISNSDGGVNVEEWYATAPSPISVGSVTVTVDSTALAVDIDVQAINGINLAHIFDPNATLPNWNILSGQTIGAPISTSTSRSYVHAFVAHRVGAILPPALNPGYVQLPATGSPGLYGTVWAAQQFNTVLSSFTIVPWNNFAVAANDSVILLVDALNIA